MAVIEEASSEIAEVQEEGSSISDMPVEASEEGEDIGEGVRKLVLANGKEDSGKPVVGATVFANYRAWVKNSRLKIFDTWEEGQPLEMTIGHERRDLKGISVGLRHMRQGERALLHVPYALAYGEEGSFSFPSVPPRADLVVEVQLNGFDNPAEGRRQANFTVEDKIESAEKRKEEGNRHFRDNNLKDALMEYQMALSYLNDEFMFQMFGKYKDMANAVRIPCLLNSAACHLKLGQFHEAVGLCSIVLRDDKDNSKALFRRGKARLALGQTDEAAEDLRRAQQLEPGDPAIKRALAEIREEERTLMEERKKLFKGVLSDKHPPARKNSFFKAILTWLQNLVLFFFSIFRRRKQD